MTLEGYAERFVRLWQSGASDQAAHDELEVLLAECPLAGRVIHGYSDEPGFGQRLSADAWKRLSWVFGSDALRTIFLGLSAREVCLRLGFSEDWLDAKLLGPRPMQFQLCIFPAASAVPATWDGIAHVLEMHYPEAWPLVGSHLAAIRGVSFADIQAQAGYNMREANVAGRDPATGESTHKHYMSLQRLLRLPMPSVVQARQFLYDELGARWLFKGDGLTYDESGEPGCEEFLARNMELGDIVGAVVVPLKHSDLLP